MKFIVGLGNPGEKYKNNRHNVGFNIAETIASRLASYQASNLVWEANSKLKAEVYKVGNVVLAKPTTFMNNSGKAVSKLVKWFKVKPEDVYVIHDDLDIKLGEYKIQKGKGPKLHYGLQSIEDALGSKNFWRVRVGVENRSTENRTLGEEYVLQDFPEGEKKVLEEVVEKIEEELYGRF